MLNKPDTGRPEKAWSRLVRSGVILLPLWMSGCGPHPPPAPPDYVLPARPDDVQLVVSNLRYDASTSGYTFAYNEKKPLEPGRPTRWVYVRKDSLVATRDLSESTSEEGRDYTTVWLRAGWDGPTKPITREELESIPSLPPKPSSR